MENFTPYSSFLGGSLIGLAATLMLFFNGRIAGVSGIMGGLFSASKTEFFWRMAFMLGMVLGAFLYYQISPDFFQSREQFPIGLVAIGGFLVGFGTRMGNGCTSGHAVCGIARFSVRSTIATIIFMLSGMMTVYIMRHILEITT